MLLSPVMNSKAQLTIFGTFAPSDKFNPELYDAIDPQTISTIYSRTDRAALLREHPVLAARIAEARIRAMFDKIIEGDDLPFGVVTDYWLRIEFQGECFLSFFLSVFLSFSFSFFLVFFSVKIKSRHF